MVYNLGVKQDGTASHFFHRAIKAYNTGTRKRRKILGQDFGDVRWHKTGKTKPVILDGVQKGCKKIMVLYTSMVRGGKSEKTNWVMHQYHLGTEEDEFDGEYIISKVFYQQQTVKLGGKDEQDIPETSRAAIVKVDPVTPQSVTPDLPCTDMRHSDLDQGLESYPVLQVMWMPSLIFSIYPIPKSVSNNQSLMVCFVCYWKRMLDNYTVFFTI